MAILVTGAAGFIGAHLCQALLNQGAQVIGIDNLNDYYSVELKKARLSAFTDSPGFTFHALDICDLEGMRAATKGKKVRLVVHLAAQAGVRYSLENPSAYIHSNLVGHGAVLEYCRHLDGLQHLIFASSSSVYGGNKKTPFSETDRVDHPVSLYAATKKADELMSYTYAHLYGLAQTGLRFFTVYGPWGRPDMAYWSFTEAILQGRPIAVFNQGDMRRDFTYIDDVIQGMMAMIDKGPLPPAEGPPIRVYNIGNNQPEQLMDMIRIIEQTLGLEAVKEFKPMQPGDVKETYADITALNRDYGFQPTTPIAEGLPRFISWYRAYHNV